MIERKERQAAFAKAPPPPGRGGPPLLRPPEQKKGARDGRFHKGLSRACPLLPVGKACSGALDGLDLGAVDDEVNRHAWRAIERIGETLEDYRLDNETCLEALQEIVDAYREELGIILGEARFWEREEQKHLEEMARGINEAYGSEL